MRILICSYNKLIHTDLYTQLIHFYLYIQFIIFICSCTPVDTDVRTSWSNFIIREGNNVFQIQDMSLFSLSLSQTNKIQSTLRCEVLHSQLYLYFLLNFFTSQSASIFLHIHIAHALTAHAQMYGYMNVKSFMECVIKFIHWILFYFHCYQFCLLAKNNFTNSHPVYMIIENMCYKCTLVIWYKQISSTVFIFQTAYSFHNYMEV